MTKTTNEQGFISAVYEGKAHKDLHTCLFACFLSQEEPKKVWTLVDLPYGNRDIGTKWIYKNKKDERGIVVRNKARLAAQGYIQEERIDYDEVFALVARIEAIRKELCIEFEKMMHKKFQMSSMGELTFFLGLQVTQKDDGIFISQDKYVDEILKKFGFSTMKTAGTPMETSKPLLKDTKAEDVDVHLYRLMIGSLMYLTASRPGIMFDVCACARFQVTPKVSHLRVVKKIFRYLKGQPKLGILYLKDSPFDLEAYTDSDYAGASLDRKSTTEGVQLVTQELVLLDDLMLLGEKLFDLENIKDAHALESNKLKKRVKKLESMKKSRTLQLKRRLFKDIEVNTASIPITTASINITNAKPVSAPVTIAGVSVNTAEPSTPPIITTTLIKDEDLITAQTIMKIRIYELAARVQEEEIGELTIEEKSRLFVELMDKRKKYFARIRAEKIRKAFVPMDSEVVEGSSQAEGSEKRTRKELDEASVKRQTLEDDKEKAKLKLCLEIVPKDDEAINIESLAIKYPIVDWKTHILDENKIQDVLDLYRLVKERFETTDPKDLRVSPTHGEVFHRAFFEKQRLTRPNFIDWYRNLQIVLSVEDKLLFLEQPIPAMPVPPAGQVLPPDVLNTHTAWVKASKEIAEQELLQTVREFHLCKQDEGKYVSSYFLKMKSYIDNLERLSHAMSQNLTLSLILVSLRKKYDSFVQNYNMHGMGKTVTELHAMLKLHEKMLPKKEAAPAPHAIKAGKEYGIIAHRTPPYTPQHNEVSERRNRTLLDMVWSMMSQTTLPKIPKENNRLFFLLPPENKIFVARNDEFLEISLMTQETSRSLEDLKIIQEEDTHPSVNTSLDNDKDDQEIDEPQSDINPIRRSSRTRCASDRMCLYIDAEERKLEGS
nr:hypothetical protein [Tanacetum cinerariifolium]